MNDSDTQIIRCKHCGAANRIPKSRLGMTAKCGKCRAALPTAEKEARPQADVKIRCTECGAKNRIPSRKLDSGPKCGKCGAKLKTEELFNPQPVMVTDANFDSQVLKSPLPVLLFAWAPWCPTCGAVTPIIDQFAAESKGKIRVGKVNVDANPALAQKFNILSVPFLFVFDNGQLRESSPGGVQKHELMMKMASYL
jgi:thioredoxin 2